MRIMSQEAGLVGRNVPHGPPVGQHDVPRTDEEGFEQEGKLPCVTGVCTRRCRVLAMRLVQSSCRLVGWFFKYSGPSRSGACPVPDRIAGWRAACADCPLRGSRSCPPGHGGKAVKNPGRFGVPAAAAAPPSGRRAPDDCCQHCFWQPEGTGGALSRPSTVQGRRNAPGRKCLALRLGLGDTPCHLHLPLDEIPIYSPVLGAAVQHLPDPF